MRIRVVVGALALAGMLVGGVALATRPASAPSGPEADAASDVEVVREAKASDLAARPVGPAVASTLRPASGRLEGEVRRAGAGLAARISVYERARVERGVDPAWAKLLEPIPTEGMLDESPCAATDAGADGLFRIDALPAGVYDVIARSASGATGAARVTMPCDRAHASVRLELGGGGPETLRVRARHADGRPFRGRACACPVGDELVFPRAAPVVAPDEDGRFVLEGLDPGPITVLAFVPGVFLARSHVVVLPRAGELDFVVDGGLADAKGRVVADADGRPVAGAIVETVLGGSTALSHAASRAVTDADGRFQLLASRGAPFWQVFAPGFARLHTSRAVPEGDGIELRLVRAGRVVGRVTSAAEGAPVGDVDVYVLDGTGEPGPHAVTDADGRYRLDDVIPGEISVVAAGAGTLVRDFEKASDRFNPFVVVLEPGGVVTVDLVVVPAARVVGTVRAADGTPVEGARVVARRKAPGERSSGTFDFLDQARSAGTDAAGAFVLDALVPGGSYDVEATAPSRSRGVAEGVRVELAAPTKVELRLGPARFAEISVRFRDGKPVAGVLVNAWSLIGEGDDSEEWESRGSAISGADGIARLGPLPPGPVSFGSWSDAYDAGEDVEAGGPEGATDPIRAELVIERAFAVSGTVRYEDGSPYEDGVIRLQKEGYSNGDGLGPDGSFRFTRVPDGVYRLEVRPAWDDSEPVVAKEVKAGDERLELVVKGPKAPRLVVTVVDPSGRPVPEASYVLTTPGGSNDGTLVDGRLRVPIQETEWSLLVFGAKTSTGAPSGLAAAVAGPFPAKGATAEVRLVPGRTIEGFVRAPDGRPVRGVRVTAAFTALPAPFGDVRAEAAATRTDEKGRFRLVGLAEGTYKVRVTVGWAFGAFEPVELVAGRTDVELVLRSGDSVHPVILDADRKPVVFAYVRVSDDTVFSDGETDAEGRVVLEGLDVSREYELEVTPPRSKIECLSRREAKWKPTSEPILLPRGLVVAGVVRDAESRPVGDAEVEARFADGGSTSATTRANGTFELVRVPEGEVTLTASKDARGDEPRRESGPTKTIAGARDVTVRLEATTILVVKATAEGPIPEQLQFHRVDEATKETDWENAGADHVATFRGLKGTSTYTFIARGQLPTTGVTLVGIAKEVKGDARTLSIALAPGLAITGRLRLPVGGKNPRIWANVAGDWTEGVVEPDGAFRIDGLPEGEHPVFARCEVEGGGTHTGDKKAAAGSVVELELHAR